MSACRCRAAFYGFALSFTLGSLATADAYRLVNYPDLQNGLDVGGTINAIDLDNDSFLDPAEITAWSLTIDGNTVTSSHPVANEILSNVSIADGMIFLEDAAVTGLEEQFALAIALDAFVNYANRPYSAEFNEQVYNGRKGPNPSPLWAAQSVPTGANLPMPASNGRMVIARLVPEPGALAQLSVAFAGLIACFSLRVTRRRVWRSTQAKSKVAPA